MGRQTTFIEEEKVDEHRAPGDGPGDLADRLYEEWRDDKWMAEAAEAAEA